MIKVIRKAIRDSQRIEHEGTRSNASANRGVSSNAASRRAKATHGGFRIVEFNVLGNHLHLLAEAASKAALSSGVAGLEVRVARRVSCALRPT